MAGKEKSVKLTRRATAPLSPADVVVSTSVILDMLFPTLAPTEMRGLAADLKAYLALPRVVRWPAKLDRKLSLSAFRKLPRKRQEDVTAALSQDRIDALLRRVVAGENPNVVFRLGRTGRRRPAKGGQELARNYAIAAEICRISTSRKLAFGPGVLDATVAGVVADAFGLSPRTVERTWKRVAHSRTEWQDFASEYEEALHAAGFSRP